MSRHLIVVLTFVWITACKIQVEVPTGGQVMSESGAYSCAENEVCEIDVVDSFFNETFLAEPNPDYVFAGWEARRGAFCGNSSDPCSLSTDGFAEFAALVAFLEDPDLVFYLAPVFESRVLDAFDPQVFLNDSIMQRIGGFTLRYSFREDGTYSFSGGGFFASGTYEFQMNNTVIHFPQLAHTDRNDLSGYVVFTRYLESANAYLTCFTQDKGVRSAAKAVDICTNGASGGIEEPEIIRYIIEE
jgi:hypothetical protein